MRYKMEKYQTGEKHIFSATYERDGSYKDKETGKLKKTILLTDVHDETNRKCADHVWIPDKNFAKYQIPKGQRCIFMARVGTYKRGRTAKDYQLRDISQVKVA